MTKCDLAVSVKMEGLTQNEFSLVREFLKSASNETSEERGGETNSFTLFRPGIGSVELGIESDNYKIDISFDTTRFVTLHETIKEGLLNKAVPDALKKLLNLF